MPQDQVLVPSTDAAGEANPGRQCGRCRVRFEGESTRNAKGHLDWWLCPPCHSVLFKRRP